MRIAVLASGSGTILQSLIDADLPIALVLADRDCAALGRAERAGIATSLVDYIFRRLALDYLSLEERQELGVLSTSERTQPTLPGVEEASTETVGIGQPSAQPIAMNRIAMPNANAISQRRRSHGHLVVSVPLTHAR